MPYLRLAITSAFLRRSFDYAPPQGMPPEAVAELKAGQRVAAPFGSRQALGILLETAEETDIPPAKLRPAAAVLDDAPLLSPAVTALCRWAADYYHHPPGEVFAAALPADLRAPAPYQPPRPQGWRLSTHGKGLPAGALPRAPRQGEILAALQRRAAIGADDFKAAGFSAAARRQLEADGLIERCALPHPLKEATARAGPALNPAQAEAAAAVRAGIGRFNTYLLDGVTGSGKTEVYLQAVAEVLRRGLQSLILVPEIGLTPQIAARFRERFDADIAVLHSGLAKGPRLKAWERARAGRAHIVIGTRSAIFCSLARPGLLVVDEEHDLSFKQQDGFRYSARDLAIKRGQLENVPVLLGSATPSLESLRNADAGKFRHLRLEQRAGAMQGAMQDVMQGAMPDAKQGALSGVKQGAKQGAMPGAARLPEFEILDVRRQPLRGGLSGALLAAIAGELDAGNQVLLFLNRRGYAPTLQCHACGEVAQCGHCDARMTVHARARELRCHHCERRRPLPPACAACGSRALLAAGVGTEQTDMVLRELYPGRPLHRVDRDSMRRKNAMSELIAEVAQGGPRILLGTQMLTKGHHFPDVTLVGLLDTDAALFSADFRGAERMGQLLTQVGGRAGRAGKPGKVLLQTHYPDHPLLSALLREGYGHYARMLLEERRQRGLPPFSKMLLLRAEAPALQAAEDFLRALREALPPAARNPARLVGPLPAPLQKKSGVFRAHLLAIAPSRPQAQSLARALIKTAESLPALNRLRWSLDIDPMDMQ